MKSFLDDLFVTLRHKDRKLGPVHTTSGSGYPHDGRAEKDSYPHDCLADNAPYRHDRCANKNPYQHDRNMRFSSKPNYALFSIFMVSVFF